MTEIIDEGEWRRVQPQFGANFSSRFFSRETAKNAKKKLFAALREKYIRFKQRVPVCGAGSLVYHP